MDKRIALLLICFLFGCTSTAGGVNTSPTPLPTLTSTLTPLPSFTPTTTLTPTPTFTPTPAPISVENAKSLVLLKTISEPYDNTIYHRFNRISFSPDFKTYTTTLNADTLILWNAVSGQQINTISVPEIHDSFYSPDGKHIFMLGRKGNQGITGLWNAETGEQTNSPCFITGLLSYDSKTTFDTNTQCEISTGKTTIKKFGCPGPAVSCWSQYAFSPNGKMVAYSSGVEFAIGKHNIILADFDTGERLFVLDADVYPHGVDAFPISSLAFSPDSKTLASMDSRNTVILWDVSTGEKISVFDPTSRRAGISFSENIQSNWGGFQLAFSPDGKILAAGYAFGSVILWDLATTQPVYVIPSTLPRQFFGISEKAVMSLVFSPDGTKLATTNRENTGFIYGISNIPVVASATAATSRSVALIDISGSFPITNARPSAYKSDNYQFSATAGTYKILLDTNDNSNICYLVWQVRPSSADPNERADMYGDSNNIGSFKVIQPGEYVISIGRARVTDKCQPFSYMLKVTRQ